jgi:CheY-like chemotaxis protein
LLEQEGLDAQGESSAGLALEQIKKNQGAYDLLLLDQTMPELTGVELIREVRRLGIETPVILCTGYSNQVNEDNAAEFGISRFLRKPLDRMQLLDTIKSLLNGSCKL